MDSAAILLESLDLACRLLAAQEGLLAHLVVSVRPDVSVRDKAIVLVVQLNLDHLFLVLHIGSSFDSSLAHERSVDAVNPA